MTKTLWFVGLTLAIGSVLHAGASPEPFAASICFNPVRRILELSADVSDFPQKGAVRSIRWTVKRSSSAQLVATGETALRVKDVLHDLARLPETVTEGKYSVELSLLDAAGKPLAAVTREFKKLDEAREFPWWGNKIGNTEKVLSPFEPVKYEGGGVVRCWGREYYLDSLGLPKQMTSAGGELLAAPAHIELVAAGKKLILATSGKPSIKVNRDYKIEFRGYARSGDLKFHSSGLFEQDGMLKLDLTITARKPSKVESLALVIPLRKENAEFMEAHGTPDGSSYTIGPVPKATGLSEETQKNRTKEPREEIVWDSSKNGPSQTGVGTFTPIIWLGNDLRGLLWFANSDRGWVPSDDVRAHEVVRRAATVLVRHNFIGKPYELKGSRTITFALMATPIKPLTKGWRMSQIAWPGGRSDAESQGGVRIEPDGRKLLHPPSPDPEAWNEHYKLSKDRAATQLEQVLYTPWARWTEFTSAAVASEGLGYNSADSRTTGYFAAEWGSNDYTPSLVDYYAYLADQWIKKGGLNALHLDASVPVASSCLSNGMAYRREDGGIQKGFHIFERREFHKRLWAVFLEDGIASPALTVSSTNGGLLPCYGWCSAVLDGTGKEISDASPDDFADAWSSDRIRASSLPRNWGITCTWTSLIRSTDQKRRDRELRTMAGHLMLHDCWWNLGPHCPTDKLFRWGMNKEDVVYHPFWRNAGLIRCKEPEVKASLYQRPGSSLIVAFNYDKKGPARARFFVDFKKLDLVPEMYREFTGAYDLETGESVPLDIPGGELGPVSIPTRDFRLIAVQRY